MRQQIIKAIEKACQDLFELDVKPELTRPDEKFGDYATNVALQLGKHVGKNPRNVAESLAAFLRQELADHVSDVSVAGPGFINLKLKDAVLLMAAQMGITKSLDGQEVVVEYSDPNPFKVLHVGHLYTTIVGDSIANLLESAGAKVHRVNYGGDVGLHVGKTMWAILKRLGGENPTELDHIELDKRADWMTTAYVEGHRAYEEDEAAKDQITTLNKRIYELHAKQDHDSALAQIYWTCRQWSYEIFDDFYARLGTKMERYYPESEVADKGLKLVKAQTGKVFSESNGAVVFGGETHGLHTRVFINSQGLPTYEAKEVGLIVKKYDDYHPDQSIIVTANEQEQYMQVVLTAIAQFMPELAKITRHIPHGMVRLSGGVKMSSRLGNIIAANEVLDITAKANRELIGKNDELTVLGAVKYAFLKSRIGGDLVYDPKESVSLEGNSGPYLQYAFVRAQSILRKASDAKDQPLGNDNLEPDERGLTRKLCEYVEVVEEAAAELMPHGLANYLYELAQTFNSFYEHNRVIADARESLRLSLVQRYSEILKDGLGLLGITAPDRM